MEEVEFETELTFKQVCKLISHITPYLDRLPDHCEKSAGDDIRSAESALVH